MCVLVSDLLSLGLPKRPRPERTIAPVGQISRKEPISQSSTIARMLDITVSESASASPEQVLAAATDLSEDRVRVWSNSKPRHFVVHAQGADFAEVTEGFRPPFGRVWERSRYEWEPGVIRQTVIDSNVLAPGSTWELKVSPSAGGAPSRCD